MITGTAKLLEWFTYNNKPFWIIRRSEKSEMITRSPEDDHELDAVRSKELLQQALFLLSPDVYYIQTWGGAKADFTTGAKTCVHFRIVDNEGAKPAQTAGIGLIDSQTFESRIDEEVNKRINAWKEKQELLTRIENLEKQIKDGDIDSGSMDKMLDRLERYTAPFFNNGKVKVGELKPVNKEEIKEMTDQQTKKIEDALGVFQAVYGDEQTVELIGKLAALAQNDKKTLDRAIKFLE